MNDDKEFLSTIDKGIVYAEYSPEFDDFLKPSSYIVFNDKRYMSVTDVAQLDRCPCTDVKCVGKLILDGIQQIIIDVLKEACHS